MNKKELENHARSSRQIEDRTEAVVSRCRGNRVLDVGCVGQARNIDHRDWLHGRLRAVASEVHGVDINESGVEKLRTLGFQVMLPHELGDNKYDRIVMADVIEHVDNPVSFLQEYAAYLAADGRMLITTPNAANLTSALLVLARNGLFVNDEHTCWYDPVTIGELARRAGLNACDFAWLENNPPAPRWPDRLLHRTTRLAQQVRPYWSDTFLVALRRGAEFAG